MAATLTITSALVTVAEHRVSLDAIRQSGFFGDGKPLAW
jgi:hypothetical protein